PAPERDAPPARAPLPRPHERDGGCQREGDARDGAALRERRAAGGGDGAAEGGGPPRRRGRRAHAGALERRVEAAGEEGGQARADRGRRAGLLPLVAPPPSVTSAPLRIIVVLGYSDGGAGTIHPICASRVARAAEISTPDDVVVLSGWARVPGTRSE